MGELPRLLSEFRRPPGVIKQDYVDFVVDEVPLYTFSGAGTHTYFQIEKTGLTTMQAAADIARALNVRMRDVGYAGLKDARAVARQWFSVEHVEPSAVAAIDLPRLKVLGVTRHANKLRHGHLRENRFRIRVRQTDTERLAELQDGLARLAFEGVPNYFGAQRFGDRGDTWIVGRAILRGDFDDAVDQLLGRPSKRDYGDVLAARRLYEEKRFHEAAELWPWMFRNERRALKTLAKTKGSRRRALFSIEPAYREFYVSAYQSHLFNALVAQRMSTGLAKLMPGDLAWVHRNDAVFLVEDVAVEQPRADAFEISPSGPLFGYRMSQPGGEPGAAEAALLAAEGLPTDAFRAGSLRIKGARRALRFRPMDAQIALGADERGAYLDLQFGLPRGCYATSLLRELFDDSADAAGWSIGEEEE